MSEQNPPSPQSTSADKEWTKTLIKWLRQISADRRLPPASFKSAFWIGDSVDRKTSDKRCSYSQAELAERAGIDIRSFGRHVAALKANGHLRVTRRGVDRPNWYHIVVKPDDPTMIHIDDRPSLSDHKDNDRTPASDQNINNRPSLSGRNVNDRTAVSDAIGQQRPTIRHSFPSTPPTSLHVEAARATTETEDHGTVEAAGLLWEKFFTAYPFDEKMSREAARVEFNKLVPADQFWVIASATKYRTSLGTASPTYAANWIVRGRFKDRPRPTGLGEASGRVFIERDTPAWIAWLAHKGVTSLPTRVDPITKREGWDMPAPWPPAAPIAAPVTIGFSFSSSSISIGAR